MKILILKASALGDIIHSFPSLHLLRDRFPDAQIDWVVEKAGAELLRAHPAVTNVIEIDSRKWRKQPFSRSTRTEVSALRRRLRQHCYDWVFDLQGNLKSSLIGWLAKAGHRVGYGWGTAPEWVHPFFVHTRINPPAGKNIREDYLHIIRSALDDWEPFEEPEVKLAASSGLDLDEVPRPIILVCPGAAWSNKQLLPEVLAEWLQGMQNAYFLLLWGNTSELVFADTLHQALPGRSQILPKLHLPALQALMGEVDRVIAMDSLPLHLAACSGTPTWAVFGPSSTRKYAPIGQQHLSFQGACPYNVSFEKRCPKLRSCGTGACIRGLTAEQLKDHFS